jgi:hypothetical protein
VENKREVKTNFDRSVNVAKQLRRVERRNAKRAAKAMVRDATRKTASPIHPNNPYGYRNIRPLTVPTPETMPAGPLTKAANAGGRNV